METEEIVIKMRGIASILKHMSYVEDDVKDKDYALELLSKELFECSENLADVYTKIKNSTL